MYSVSNDYLTAMMSKATRRRIRGTIGNVAFTQDDIIENTFSISNRCAEESDMKIGGVYIGTLEMTLKPSFLTKIARNQYQGEDVTVSIGLKVGESWVYVPCGIFTLQAPKISKNGVSLEGYDYMKKLDKTFNMSTTSGKVYDFLQLIETNCGVTCGMTQADCEALPNGDIVIAMYAENDVETYRDMLYWLAQTTGRFATINRLGQLELRKFGIPNSVELDEMHRDTDVVFSGYITHWTGISVVDMATEMTNYYGLDPDDGLTMNLGSNPFLQYGLPEVVEAMRIAVLEEIADIAYTPYNVISARDPIFDLGDEIAFSGGISGDCTGCVMSYNYTISSFEFEGYGDDPALANGRSKVDKNISGLMSKTESQTVTYFSFENIAEIAIGEETEVAIGRLGFAAKKETEVVVQMEFMLNTTSTAADTRTIVYNDIEDDPETAEDETETVEVGYFDKNETPIIAHLRYYYDDNLVGYEPIETWTEEGYHVLHGFYHIKEVDIEREHTWRVTVELTNGTGVIGIGDAHILVNGQGLVTEEKWDGHIDVTDEIGKYNVKTITAMVLDDADITVTIQTPTSIVQIDSMDLQDVTVLDSKELEEGSLAVVLKNIVFRFVTEDGEYNIVSEDGIYNITTEGNDE